MTTTWITICDTCKRDDWAARGVEQTDGERWRALVEAAAEGTGLADPPHLLPDGLRPFLQRGDPGAGQARLHAGPVRARRRGGGRDRRLRHGPCRVARPGQVPYRDWPQAVKGHFVTRHPPLPRRTRGGGMSRTFRHRATTAAGSTTPSRFTAARARIGSTCRPASTRTPTRCPRSRPRPGRPCPTGSRANGSKRAARAFWMVPEEAAVLAAPGASALIANIPHLRPAGPRAHPRAHLQRTRGGAFAQRAGRCMRSDPEGDPAEARVVVHPNNPTGHMFSGDDEPAEPRPPGDRRKLLRRDPRQYPGARLRHPPGHGDPEIARQVLGPARAAARLRHRRSGA